MTGSPNDLEAAEPLPTEEKRWEPLTRAERAEWLTVTDVVRDAGTVLAADPTGTRVKLWVHGVTPHEGVVIERPEGLPKWMAVSGATFDAWGVDYVEALSAGVFTKHSVDEQAPYPPDSAEEAERLRAQLGPEDWQRYLDHLEAAPAYREWVSDLREEMRTRRPSTRYPRPKTGRVLKPKSDAGKLVPAAPISPQRSEGTSGGWLCCYPIRRHNGTLVKLCENRVSAEGVLCHEHR